MSDIIHSRRLTKKLTIFLLAAILGFAASAGAAQNVTISWNQPSSGEPVLAYQLYQDDLLICETSDPAARSITCPAELGGKGFFRVAAVYDAGGEVEPVNNPPVAQDLAVTLNENETVASFLSATDPDNDPLNYAILTAPTSGAAVLIDSVSGEFQYTPNKDFSGSDSFTYQASDGSANSATATVSLTVMPPVNDPPVANAGPDQVVNEGETVTLDATQSADPDDGIASYSWTQLSGSSAPLSASGAVQPTFTAPDVEGEGEVLTYQL
ncbi:MAG: cadherin-like domain-containing protein, partial [Desulfobulbaceae bacterium]|nr:cadherin-like domain-containing protein [Desulfobulbaceae bacterium]